MHLLWNYWYGMHPPFRFFCFLFFRINSWNNIFYVLLKLKSNTIWLLNEDHDIYCMLLFISCLYILLSNIDMTCTPLFISFLSLYLSLFFLLSLNKYFFHALMKLIYYDYRMQISTLSLQSNTLQRCKM